MGTPAATARSTASRTRSSASRRGPAYNAEAGTPARSASSTAFRPATTSAASPAPRGRPPAASARGRASPPRSAIFDAERLPLPGPVPATAGVRASSPGPGRPARLVPRAAAFAAASARRCAGWPGRRCAGGVGPLPSSRLRPLPPVPARGLPDFARPPPPAGASPLTVLSGGTRPRTGSSLDRPPGAVRGVLEEDPDGVQPVPDCVRRLVVLAVLGRLPLLDRHPHQRFYHVAQVMISVGRGPFRGQRVQSEHVQHGPHLGQRRAERRGVPAGQRLVPVVDRVVDDRQRLGRGQVVVE